jgi:hypothetical protein
MRPATILEQSIRNDYSSRSGAFVVKSHSSGASENLARFQSFSFESFVFLDYIHSRYISDGRCHRGGLRV